MSLIKQIDFPPYNEAEIKAVRPDGYLCNLRGDEVFDTDILISLENDHFSITEAEAEELKSPQKISQQLQ